MSQRFRWRWLLLCLLSLGGCMTTATHEVLPDSLAPTTTLPLEPGEYEGLVWLDTEHLVTQYQQPELQRYFNTRIGVINTSQLGIDSLELPPHPICEDQPYNLLMPVRTPTDQLAFLCRCGMQLPAQEYDYAMLYDPYTGASNPLRSDKFDPITDAGGIGFVDDYSFFPDMKTGVLVDSWTGARQLHTFDETSVTRVDLGVDVVGSAMLSPDGTKLLITTQEGDKGIAMLDEPYQIELVDPITWERRPLFSGYNVASITWSPDSQHVAIGTNTANGEPYDLWVINADTGIRRRVGRDFYGHIAWSPDGTTLAATRLVNPGSVMNTDREIVLLDLTQVELP